MITPVVVGTASTSSNVPYASSPSANSFVPVPSVSGWIDSV